MSTDPTPDTRLADLERQLAERTAELAQAREALDAAERRRTIAEHLAQSDAIDLEAAALLTELAVASMPEPDVAAAVADLRRRKPFLFRTPARSTAMSPEPRATAPDPLADAADAARTTGDRRALLDYLRLRRRA